MFHIYGCLIIPFQNKILRNQIIACQRYNYIDILTKHMIRLVDTNKNRCDFDQNDYYENEQIAFKSKRDLSV